MAGIEVWDEWGMYSTAADAAVAGAVGEVICLYARPTTEEQLGVIVTAVQERVEPFFAEVCDTAVRESLYTFFESL